MAHNIDIDFSGPCSFRLYDMKMERLNAFKTSFANDPEATEALPMVIDKYVSANKHRSNRKATVQMNTPPPPLPPLSSIHQHEISTLISVTDAEKLLKTYADILAETEDDRTKNSNDITDTEEMSSDDTDTTTTTLS